MSRICELCKTENDDDSQFCDKCGNPLVEIKETEVEDDKPKVEVRKVKPLDMKLLLIPLLLVILVGAYFVVMNVQGGDREKAARQVVSDYLGAIKEGKYSKALEIATGTALSPEQENQFVEFMAQVPPPLPVNSNFIKTLGSLKIIADAVKEYRRINGKYPQDLATLAPVTIKALPAVEGGGEFGYEYDSNTSNFTVFVKGKTFEAVGMPENFPAYSTIGDMQTPGAKYARAVWKLNGFEIIEVKSISKDTARVKVKEVCQFGTGTKTEEDDYNLALRGGRWYIDIESSPLEVVTLTNAFTKLASIWKVEVPETPKDPNAPPPPPGEAPPPPPPDKRPDEVKLPLGMALLSYSKIIANPDNINSRVQCQYRMVVDALDKITASLARYGGNHEGKYPDKLSWLIPEYLTQIPLNPAALDDTFSMGYTVSDNKDSFTLVCQGEYFKSLGIEKGYPLYSSKFKKMIENASQVPAEVEETPTPTGSPEGYPSPDASASPGATPTGSPSPGVSPTGAPSPEPSGSKAEPAKTASPDAKAGEPGKTEPSKGDKPAEKEVKKDAPKETPKEPAKEVKKEEKKDEKKDPKSK
ncbi:MAG: hypothetical protein LWY06_15155 [Firmicutes bacterium]|nr:hypothetical protein [Bacillota bacterium]